jgi:hypothetical protein
VRERQHADAVERPLRRAEVARRSVAGLLKDNGRLACEKSSLRVSQPFSRLAYDARRQARGASGLFQLERIPLPDGRRDLGGVGWYVKETAGTTWRPGAGTRPTP